MKVRKDDVEDAWNKMKRTTACKCVLHNSVLRSRITEMDEWIDWEEGNN